MDQLTASALEALGINQDALLDRLVERLASEFNDDGAYFDFRKKLDERIAETVEAKIQRLAETHVLPNVTDYIENLTLQKTNEWGEARGQAVTFIEYLVQRAEAYMLEKVNYEGKPKNERDSFGWQGKSTRLAFLIDKHLHYEIEKAMKSALEVATSSVSSGIQETVRMKLDEIVKGLRVAVETKR